MNSDSEQLILLMNCRSEQELMEIFRTYPSLKPVARQYMKFLGLIAKESVSSFLEHQEFIHEVISLRKEYSDVNAELLLQLITVWNERELIELMRKQPELGYFVHKILSPKESSRFEKQFDKLKGLPDSAEGIEEQILIYQDILKDLGRDDDTFLRGTVNCNLGACYSNRIYGDLAKNKEQAIAACTTALQFLTKNENPIEWGNTQINLGIAYAKRIRGNRVENLECAISALIKAQETITEDKSPEKWAVIQINLASAFYHRIQGDPIDNKERAFFHTNAASKILSPNEFTELWAANEVARANILSDRYQGDRSQNLELAISAYKNALQVYTQDRFPLIWAQIHNNLGMTYLRRLEGDSSENKEYAINACREALKTYSRSQTPLEWAGVHQNLGIIYSDRIQGDYSDNLELSIQAYEAALQVISKEEFPLRWAEIKHNLGALFARCVLGVTESNQAEAIASYQASLEVATFLGYKDFEYKAARDLGRIFYDNQQWVKAYNAFKTSVSALETLRTGYFTDEARRVQAEENALLYGQLVDTCLQIDKPEEALEWVEAGKNRLFLEQLGNTAFNPPSLPSKKAPLLEKETRLANELLSLRMIVNSITDLDTQRNVLTKMESVRANLRQVWSDLESDVPAYVEIRRGDPISYEKLQSLLDKFNIPVALVEFFSIPEKLLIFVLKSRGRKLEVISVNLPYPKLRRHLNNFIREIVGYCQYGDIGQRWQALAQPLLAELLPMLEGMQLVYLIPHGMLHYLPLHALKLDGLYLIERYPIIYAPSASVLNRVIDQSEFMLPQKRPSALVLGNPTLDLHYAGQEAKEVARLLSTKPYIGREATKAKIQSELGEHRIMHFACHGYFDPEKPLQSGIVLANGERLTAKEIMDERLEGDIVTLSACSTGHSDISAGDELVGLPRAFLFSGVRSLLVTLWTVNDMSTRLFMTDFYQRLYDSEGNKICPIANAFQEATLNLISRKVHPYYWAPFLLIGHWN